MAKDQKAHAIQVGRDYPIRQFCVGCGKQLTVGSILDGHPDKCCGCADSTIDPNRLKYLGRVIHGDYEQK